MRLELEDELDPEDEATELDPFFAPTETAWQMEDADERRRNALAERLPEPQAASTEPQPTSVS